MLNDSSKKRAEFSGQRAESAGGSGAPIPPAEVSSQSQVKKQAVNELSPQNSALPTSKVPWGPWAGIVYAVLVFFASQFLVALILYTIADLRGLKGDAAADWLATVPLQFIFILCAEALTFGAILWFLRYRRTSPKLIGLTKFRWMHVVWALCGFAVYFVAYVALYYFVTKFVPSIDVNQEQDIGFKDVTGAVPLALTFISLVILPPIVEETVFRGFIFTGLRKYRFIIAALVTSVLFAAAHLEFGNGKPLLWIAALDTFTLSMVLCYIREKTGSIVPTIFIHAIKNCLAFLVLYIFVT